MSLISTSDINTYIAKANEQIAKFGSQKLNPEVFYSLQLLDTIRLGQENYLYYRYADSVPIPNGSNKLMVRRWAPLQAHTTPLVEGVPPTSDKGSMEYYEVGTNQYGRYMEFSDKVDFKIVDPILVHYTREYATVAVETLDLLAREVLFALSNKVYAGYVAGFENLTVASKPTITDLRKIVLSLKKQLVKPRSNGAYHVIAGPDFYFDMVSDPTVEKFMTFNQNTYTMYKNTKLVPMFDLEFYETLACPVSGEFTKMVNSVATKAIRVVGLKSNGDKIYGTLDESSELSSGRSAASGPFAVGSKKVYATFNGYVTDSRTEENASYIPGQHIWDLDAVLADTGTGGLNAAGGIFGDDVATAIYEFKVMKVLVLGKDCLIRTGLSGRDQVKVYTKSKGSAGVLDPIDQRQSIGFKIDDIGFGSARLEAIVEYDCVPSTLNVV